VKTLTRHQVRVLMALADKAKNFGLYWIANAIFAILLAEFFRLIEEDQDKPDADKGLYLEYQTDDLGGRWPGESYFDLLRIHSPGLGDVGGPEPDDPMSICIPVPLVEKLAILTCGKRVDTPYPRTEHRRYLQTPSQEMILSLWVRLTCVVSPKEIVESVNRYLDVHEENVQKVLAQVAALVSSSLVENEDSEHERRLELGEEADQEEQRKLRDLESKLVAGLRDGTTKTRHAEGQVFLLWSEPKPIGADGWIPNYVGYSVELDGSGRQWYGGGGGGPSLKWIRPSWQGSAENETAVMEELRARGLLDSETV